MGGQLPQQIAGNQVGPELGKDNPNDAQNYSERRNQAGHPNQEYHDNVVSDGTSKSVEGFVGSEKSSKSHIILVSKFGNIEVE